MPKRTTRKKTTNNWDKPRLGSPRFEKVIQEQIREYEATNRHGPGDHTFRVLPEDRLLGLYSEEFFQIGMQLKRIEKKLDLLVFNKPQD
jgi:hypothetical protein